MMRSSLRTAPWALSALLALGPPGCSSSRSPTSPPPVDTGPDWRDQVIYFVMTDRFNDGDPSNNDQGAGEYDPSDEAKYSGGDLKGVNDKLDYIQGLGATAVWVTPPVANQWWDPWVRFSGYHGYWTRHFRQVDEHYGTLESYKALADALHARKMLLVQDIVVNHTGNFFRYNGAYDASDITRNFERNTATVPFATPTQAPFDLNDASRADHREAAIYHWTPSITDFQDPSNRFTYQLSDLDDLNTENPVVANALKDSYNFWIQEVGVDGFRIDTVLYTDPAFYADFMHSEDPEHPGIQPFAKRNGKPGFFAFGETWFSPTPYDDSADRAVAEYIEKDGRPLIDSALNFPLHFTLQSVFAEGRPTRELAWRLETAFRLHKDPQRLVNFIDNHDKPRFASIGSRASMKQALAFVLTIPGVPVIYYGTEQGFSETRPAMFAGGVQSGGKDHFDTESELYRFLQEMIRIRKAHTPLRRATPKLLKSNGAGPGVLAYLLDHDQEKIFVIFNTSDEAVLLDNLDTGLPEGTELELLASLTPGGTPLVVGAGGRLSTPLVPRAGLVLRATDTVRPVTPSNAVVTIDFPANAVFSSNPRLNGRLEGAQELLLVVDGQLSSAQRVTAAADGTWSAELQVEGLRPDASIPHTVVAYVESQRVLSTTHGFTVDLAFRMAAELEDPAGDDRGPSGTYGYPTDITYRDRHMDIRKVTVRTAGKNLRISVQMNAVSSVWNPIFGFDHVAFSLYLDVPGQEGVTVLPRQNAVAPEGLRWDYQVLTGGWINAMYTSQGATADQRGASTGPAAEVTVDKATRTIHFFLPPRSLGNPASLSGVRIYFNTWDYDNGYRNLTAEPEQWSLSGGNFRTSPLIMDDIPVLTVP